jgi:hypothetical protein
MPEPAVCTRATEAPRPSGATADEEPDAAPVPSRSSDRNRRLTAALAAQRRMPRRNRLLRQPHRQIAPPDQRRIIFRPVRHLVLRLRKFVSRSSLSLFGMPSLKSSCPCRPSYRARSPSSSSSYSGRGTTPCNQRSIPAPRGWEAASSKLRKEHLMDYVGNNSPSRTKK